jgi:hypothetical protein
MVVIETALDIVRAAAATVGDDIVSREDVVFPISVVLSADSGKFSSRGAGVR